MIGVTELVDGKLEDGIVARAYAYLVEIGQLVVHLADEVFLGKRVADALLQLRQVRVVVEQHGVGFLSVAPGASCLLEVGFDAAGAVDVDDQSHVGLVDAHAEGVGSHDDALAGVGPLFLVRVLCGIIHSGVEIGGIQSLAAQHLGIFAGTAAASDIDDG